MADEIRVSIIGKDGVSKVFEGVSKGAESMQDRVEAAAKEAGQSLDEMGKRATTAASTTGKATNTVGQSSDKMGKEVTENAREAGQSLDKMSKDAEKAASATAKNLDRMSEAAKNADRAFTVAGAALGASLALFSREITDNEQQVRNLERTYGEAAGQFQQFAQQMQNTTIFSSEDFVRAENIFGTLRTNYQLTTEQVQKLVQVTADLATAHSMSLVDAATRVQAAIRGEGEAAEALGLTMNQQSIDRQNLTLTMTNQEAAQYRYTALLEQASVSEGAAAEKASTLSGRLQQVANTFDDGARAAIGFAGPLPQVISGITSVGKETGLAVSGLASLGKGIKEASVAAGGLKPLLTSAAGSGVGMFGLLGLAAAATTVGVVALSRAFQDDFAIATKKADQSARELDITLAQLTATMANTTLALNLTEGDKTLDDIEKRIQRIKELEGDLSLEETANTVTGIKPPDVSDADWQALLALIQAQKTELAGLTAELGDATTAQNAYNAAADDLKAIYNDQGPGAALALKELSGYFDQLESGALTFDEFVGKVDDLAGRLGELDQQALATAASNKILASSFADVTTAIAGVVASDAPKALSDTALALQGTTVQVLDSLRYFTEIEDAYWGLSGGAQAYANVQNDVNNILANGNVEQLQALAMLEAMHKSHQISADTLATEIAGLSSAVDKTTASNTLAEASQKRLNEAMSAGEAGARKQAGSVSELSETTVRGSAVLVTFRDIVDSNAETAERAAGAYAHMAEEISHIGKFAEIDLGNIKTVERAYDAWRGEAESLVIVHGKLNDSLAGGTDELAAYQQQLEDTAKSIGLMTNAQQLAAGGIATPSLDVAVNLQMGQGGFDAVMGAIKSAQSMSQSLGGAKSWADELIGDRGTWSELDNLINEGRIDAERWEPIQQAQESITRDVANAQRDLLAVQVNLAPTLAAATHAQAEYINSLQDMDEQQQLAALGYMDSGEAAKAMSLAQLVASSSTKEMKESTALMVQQAADADPVLKAMLQDMQLLDENGNVKFDTNADDMAKAITELTGAVRDLTDVIDDLPGINTSSNAGDTQKDVGGLTRAVNDIPDSSTTVIEALDQATGTIAMVGAQLRALDQSEATVYIRAVQTGATLAGVGASVSGARNGGVLSYANGGVVMAELAEAGPELLTFRDGGQALVPHRGIYSVPVGTSVLPAPATKARLGDEYGGGDYFDFSGSTINIIAANADVEDQLRAWSISRARG